jgi:hypothetical protein
MKTARLTGYLVAILVSLTLPGTLLAGALDEYYLARFGETPQKITAAVLQQTSPSVERCGTPLRRSLRKDWSLLEPATQKTLAKYLALPTLSGPESTILSPSGRFRIHYTTTGADAATTSWAQTTAQVFDEVYAKEVTNSGNPQNMGYQPAPTRNGAPYDVYLQDLASIREFGHTNDTGLISGGVSATSYTVVDRSFSSSIYEPYTGITGLKVTAAHEYHHAIQFGYNYYFDMWYGEATSTWMEDEVYDDVNQLYTYLLAAFSNPTLSLDTAVSTSTGGGYGRWLFNRYLAEQHGVPVVRRMWENLALMTAPAGGADIPMVPILDTVLSQGYSRSLPTDFFGFTRRVYTRDWATHQSDIGLIPRYIPVATYYPSNGTVAAPTTTLAPLSYAYYRYLPSATAPVDLTITTTPSSTQSVTAFKTDSLGTITESTPDPTTGTIVIRQFGSSATTEAVLLVTNTSTATSPTTPTTPTTPTYIGGGGGGGGGCFIATAAYGSYLHPRVQALRNFRDTVLLTNAPGRTLVGFYYRLSPPLADVIRQHAMLRAGVRLFLAPVVFTVQQPWSALLAVLALVGSGGIWLRTRRRTAAAIYS